MKIAVIGSLGQLGGELCRQLGHQAIGLSQPEFDLTDARQVREQLASIRPDAVINAAGYTRVDQAEREAEACFAVNAHAVGVLADVARAQDALLVQISSDFVFGADRERRVPYREQDQPAPQGVYARSKLAGECEAAASPRHLIVRTCGLYRARPAGPIRGRNFVDTMLALAGERKTLRVVNDQTCCPTYVPHLARAIAFLVGQRREGIYHVVNGGATTWYDFAAEIFRRCKIAVELLPVSTADYGAPAPRPAYSVLDTAKYQAAGGPPMPAWTEGLAAYFRDLAAGARD